MTSAFAAALDALFADPRLACYVVYTTEGGSPVLVRATLRRADNVISFDEECIWSQTSRLDLRLAEVTNPRPGDRSEIDGGAFLIRREPVRDREWLVWTGDPMPAS